MPCDKCNSLNKQLSHSQPHSDLEFTGSSTYSGSGFRRVNLESYSCRVCSQHFARDMDDKDHGACWEFAAHN